MIQRIPDAWPDPGDGGGRRPTGSAPSVEGAAGGRSLGSIFGLALLVIFGSTIGAVVLVRAVSDAGRARVEAIDAEAIERVPGSLSGAWPDLGAITEGDIEAWIERLADPRLQGRDTPSPGLLQAQAIVAAEFVALGLQPLPQSTQAASGSSTPPESTAARQPPAELAGYFRPFEADAAFFGRAPFEQPEPEACGLRSLSTVDERPFVLGVDFVPLASSSLAGPAFRGEARGPLCFAGFGIDSEPEGYDDFAHTSVRGAIAVILDGEPEGGAFGASGFGGPEVTAEASVWNKIDALAREGARGALIVRTGALSFRATRAFWNPPTFDRIRAGIPSLEVSAAAASRLLGQDVEALRAAIHAAGSPVPAVGPLPEVELRAGTVRSPATLFNVVGWLAPSANAAAPSPRPLVIGAHLDHIGVGPRGRVALGADDNASGVAALLGIARSLSALEHRQRGVVFCAFTGEEDDLLGSKQLAAELAVEGGAAASPVAMLNLDMIGRGSATEVALFGLHTAADLRPRLDLALSLDGDLPNGHGVQLVNAVTDANFFQRSDHHAFHRRGVPVLFFFEEWPHRSPDYHTWRDTPEGVNAGKVTRVARLAALIAATWLTQSPPLPPASR